MRNTIDILVVLFVLKVTISGWTLKKKLTLAKKITLTKLDAVPLWFMSNMDLI